MVHPMSVHYEDFGDCSECRRTVIRRVYVGIKDGDREVGVKLCFSCAKQLRDCLTECIKIVK